MPRFEIVNVPPSRSSLLELAVARAADDVGAGVRDLRDVERSAPRITGTTSPCGAATAMPTFAVGKQLDARPR